MKSTKKMLNIFLMIILAMVIIMQSSIAYAATTGTGLVVITGTNINSKVIVDAYNNDKSIIDSLTWYQTKTWQEGLNRKPLLPLTEEDQKTLAKVSDLLKGRMKNIEKQKKDILGGKTVTEAKSWTDITGAYKKDKNIINYLTDDEAEVWKTEVDAAIGLMNDPSQSWPQEEKDLANYISAAFNDRRKDANVSSLKENGSGFSNDYLITHCTTIDSIEEYLNLYGGKDLNTEVRDAWRPIIEKETDLTRKNRLLGLLEGKTEAEVKEEQDMKDRSTSIYQRPQQDNSERTAAENLDDMISDADSFINQGGIEYEDKALQQFSSILFNIFSVVGAAVALIVGIVIGVKYMMGSIEEKADYKQMLLPYVIGCIVVFGGFGIWKIVITILESI